MARFPVARPKSDFPQPEVPRTNQNLAAAQVNGVMDMENKPGGIVLGFADGRTPSKGKIWTS